jgi:RNase P subunit RPR2
MASYPECMATKASHPITHHSLTMTDRERIKTFLKKYAGEHALLLPGRMPNYKSENVFLLPSDTTAADIHALYERLAQEMDFRSVHLRTFQRTWHDICPYITIMKPTTDLCQHCQEFLYHLSNVLNMNDEEKEDMLSAYTCHVSGAKEQRYYYRRQCSESKDTYVSLDEEIKQNGKLKDSYCNIFPFTNIFI